MINKRRKEIVWTNIKHLISVLCKLIKKFEGNNNERCGVLQKTEQELNEFVIGRSC